MLSNLLPSSYRNLAKVAHVHSAAQLYAKDRALSVRDVEMKLGSWQYEAMGLH